MTQVLSPKVEPPAARAEIRTMVSKNSRKHQDSSTCASTVDLFLDPPPLGKTVTSTSDVGHPVEKEYHLVERRSLLSCVDPVGIVRGLYNFDWSRVVLRCVLVQCVIHALAYQGFKKVFSGDVYASTIMFSLFVHFLAALGVTAGLHRHWAHKTYKAHRVVQYVLMVFSTLACQNSIYEWCRDHRVHHKYSETSADPHNADEGLFFAHMGWLMVRKHDDVKEKGKSCMVTDLEKDTMIMWQHRNYVPFAMFVSVVIPTILPCLLFNEGLWTSYVVAIARIALTLHVTWCVNSLAHWWGSAPYDATIYPVENYLVTWMTCGEGWHNYHHAFPNDYRASDRTDPFYFRLFFNPTQIFIDGLAQLGLVWGRNKTPKKMVEHMINTKGDQVLRNRQK